MSLADHYPVGMSICDSYGIAGNCGYRCPLVASMECEYIDDTSPEEIADSRGWHGYHEEDVFEAVKEIRRERKERKQNAVSNP